MKNQIHSCRIIKSIISTLLDDNFSNNQNATTQQIYSITGNCPSCIDIADFLIERKRVNMLSIKIKNEFEPLEEKQLRILLQKHKFDESEIIENFKAVIMRTISKLKIGEKMKLYSSGELLEAHYSYAYSEVRKAVDRGVKFEYILPGGDCFNDFNKLNSQLLEVFSKEKISEQITVNIIQEDDPLFINKKNIFYYDKNDKEISRLIEVPITEQHPFDQEKQISSRIWINVDDDKKEFVNDLNPLLVLY